MREIVNPHDKAFRRAMANKQVAKEMFEQGLNKEAEISDMEVFKQVLTERGPKLREGVMTIYQHFEQQKREQRQQGIEQGREQGVREAAKRMLAGGMDLSKVAELLGLPIKELEALA